MKRIYLVRHGTPEGLLASFAGVTDLPLSEQGKEEAARTGRWFAEQGFAGAIYSSPLSRAYDTARIIVEEISESSCEEANIPANIPAAEKNEGNELTGQRTHDCAGRNCKAEFEIKVIDELMECDLGILEGMTMEQVNRDHPEEAREWYSDVFNNAFPGGESLKQSGLRFARGIDRILEENSDDNEDKEDNEDNDTDINNNDIIVTAHMCVIESYLVIKGLIQPSEELITNPIPCASITTLMIDGDGSLSLEYLGFTPQ